MKNGLFMVSPISHIPPKIFINDLEETLFVKDIKIINNIKL